MTARRRDKTAGDERRGTLRPMAALLPGLTRRALGKHGFAAASLITDWPRIVGEDMAAATAPVKLAFPRGERSGGTLHLRVSGGGAALELQHMETQIVERLNAHLGYGAVAALKLVQGGGGARRRAARKERPQNTVPPPDIAACPSRETIAKIEEPGLRAALERMGALVAARESVRKSRG